MIWSRRERNRSSDNAFFDPSKFPGAVWVLDEAQYFWPSGIKVVNVPDQEKEFFTEHRHHVGPDGQATEIVLITLLFKCAHNIYYVK